MVAKREKTYEGSVPLVTFGALTAAIIAVITLLHGAAIYIPTWLWSMDLMNVDPQIYRLVWWGLGHSSQQINVAAMVSIWYLLATLTVGGVVLNQKISRTAFVLYILFISMASAHHLLVDPGLRRGLEGLEHQLLHVHGGAGQHDPRLHGARRASRWACGCAGYTQGIFGWLRRAPVG